MVSRALNISLIASGLATLYLIITVGLAIFTYRAGEIEGALWPVAEATELIMKEETNGTTLVTGVMDKYRDCTFIKTVWKYGDTSELRSEFLSRPRLYPPIEGAPFGPVRIFINEADARLNLQIITHHDCHPLWATVTTLHPPSGEFGR